MMILRHREFRPLKKSNSWLTEEASVQFVRCAWSCHSDLLGEEKIFKMGRLPGLFGKLHGNLNFTNLPELWDCDLKATFRWLPGRGKKEYSLSQWVSGDVSVSSSSLGSLWGWDRAFSPPSAEFTSSSSFLWAQNQIFFFCRDLLISHSVFTFLNFLLQKFLKWIWYR